MQRTSTPLATTLGAAAVLSTAAAWGAACIRYDASAPRLDVLVPLALAAVFAGGWLLASRAAPPVEPLPATAPPRERIPGKLGAVRRDWGFFAASCLTIWAPYVAARTAYGDGGSALGSAYCAITLLFGAVLSLYAISLLKSQLGPAQRMLRKDAAAGSVHAVRVRFGTPVQDADSSSYYVELVLDVDARRRPTVRLQAMPGYNFREAVGAKHLTHAAARLVGHGGWLCWPSRWRYVALLDKQRTVSAAFVSDSGHVVWGVTPEEDYAKYLRGDAARAPLCETDTALAVEPLPQPSRYFPKAHASSLRVAAVGALLAVPFLLGVVPYWVGLLLGVIAGAVGLFAGMTMEGVGVDQEPWTVRER